MSDDQGTALFERLDLTEYETTALRELLTLGRTTAPDLAEATGIPKARIYGVLDELAEAGYVKVIPGRPKAYQPRPPADIVDRAIENSRQTYERRRDDIRDASQEFLDAFEPLYERASEDITPTEELFYVVDVGDASETETRALYHDASESIYVITKSFEYLDRVESALADALDRDITVRVLFLDPDRLSAENRAVQRDVVERLRRRYPSVSYRFSVNQQPWRGTFVDPSPDYESGRAILLVEEKEVPVQMRQAAITENGSFVAGLKRYFDLVWRSESREPEEL